MHIKKSFAEIIFDAFNHLFLAFWAFIALYPMLYVLFASFSEPTKFIRFRGFLMYPQGFSLISYKAVMQNPNIISGYRNTFFVVIFGTLLNLLMTSLGAYFLSRRNVMWKNAFMIMIVITMYFSGGLIPGYLVVTGLGMKGSLLALIIPGAVSAYNIIVMRTSIQSGVPAELEEAAIIDGGGHFTVLFKIVLPLSKAVLAVMALWYGVGHWNSWYSAAIYLDRREKWPLQLIIREIIAISQAGSGGGGVTMGGMTTGLGMGVGDIAHLERTVRFATIIVATVPILLLYPFLQKHFVKGVLIGSLKG